MRPPRYRLLLRVLSPRKHLPPYHILLPLGLVGLDSTNGCNPPASMVSKKLYNMRIGLAGV